MFCPFDVLLFYQLDPVDIVISLLGKRKLIALFFFGLELVYCLLQFFALPLAIIGRLCSLIVPFLEIIYTIQLIG